MKIKIKSEIEKLSPLFVNLTVVILLLYSIHTNTLRKIANSFNLGLSTSINQVSTKYTDNPNKSNSVIDLMFL